MTPTADRVLIFDTTLRDGEQAPGCSMTQPEKLRVARALADLGVDVIEAGFPAASRGDWESVNAVAREVQGPIIAGLARCVREDIELAAKALKDAPRHRLHLRHNHHLPNHRLTNANGRRSGTTTQTDTCSQHNPGESQGRPPKSPGSQPIVQNGLPSASSQEDPCPGSPDRTRGAGRSLQAWIFMPRDASARRRRTQASANSGRCGSWLRQRPAFVGRANAGRPNCGPELRGRRVSDSVPTGLDRLDGPEMHEIRALEDARRR